MENMEQERKNKIYISLRQSKERVKMEDRIRKEFKRRDKARQVKVSDLEEEVKQERNIKYVSRLDLEKHIFNKCNKCLKECEHCIYRDIRNDLIGPSPVAKWVARVLIQYGNCYVANKLNAREIMELENLINAKIIQNEPLIIKKGYVLEVID